MIKAGLPMKNGLILTPSTVEQAIPFGGYTGQLPSGKVSSLSVNAGDNIIVTLNRATATNTTQSPFKCFELITDTSGIYRLSFDLWSDYNSIVVHGQVYKNGSPVGTLQSMSTTGAVIFTEDISFNAGDKIQIYGYTTNGVYGFHISTMSIKCALKYPTITGIVIS